MPKVKIKNRSEYSDEFKLSVCKYAHEHPEISTTTIGIERNCSASAVSAWYAQFLLDNNLTSSRRQLSSGGRKTYASGFKKAIADAWILEEQFGSKTFTAFCEMLELNQVTVMKWVKAQRTRMEVLSKIGMSEDELRQLLS